MSNLWFWEWKTFHFTLCKVWTHEKNIFLTKLSTFPNFKQTISYNGNLLKLLMKTGCKRVLEILSSYLCQISDVRKNVLAIYERLHCLELHVSSTLWVHYIICYINSLNWLIDWLFKVLRPVQEYFTYMETSLMPVKGCKI
jgi:hypothetical protein